VRSGPREDVHVIDGTMLVFLGVFLVAFERIGFATIIGGVGLWMIAHYS
jgi:hypothetical protein